MYCCFKRKEYTDKPHIVQWNEEQSRVILVFQVARFKVLLNFYDYVQILVLRAYLCSVRVL
jgi:hypothetical protein